MVSGGRSILYDRGKVSKPLISVLVPVLNEADNILPLYEALEGVMDQVSQRYQFELIFTDNHSDDRTFPILEELAERDGRIRVYPFSRNFGFQRSILAGYLNARGDAVVQIDCGLQDPPEIILKFIEAWEQGYQVVHGVRRSRSEAWLLRKARDLFYSLVDLLSEYLGRIYKQSKKQPLSIVQFSIENGVVADHAAPPGRISAESQSSS